MASNIEHILFSSIKSLLAENAPLECGPLCDEELGALYALSKKHDLVHLVGFSLQQNGILAHENPWFAKFEKQQLIAVFRQEQLDFELMQIRSVFEEAKLRFLPLKGSVLRALYPAPWMRTSCDIDVLVDEQNLDACVALLCERLGYRAAEHRDYHDISLYAPSGVHLELHFSILEKTPTLDTELSRVWEFASPIAEGAAEHRLTNEFLMFHSVAHAAYHFVGGGCGIRPLIDLYLMTKKLEINNEVLHAHLAACSLERFYEAASALSEVWFGEAKPSDLTDAMQQYLLTGGVYGTAENRISMVQASGKTKQQLWQRVFLPYEDLCLQYPILKKHKWFTPICQIRRWGRLFVGKTARRSLRELRIHQQTSQENRDEAEHLLQSLGLPR